MHTRPHPPCLPAALLALAVLSASCGVPVTPKPSLTSEDVHRKADTVRAAPRSRAEVRELLGEPWITSDRWRVEVYRAQGQQPQWMLVLTPWPVPMPMPAEKLRGYTLVSYSPAGIVEAIDAGFVNASAGTPLVLRAGDWTFIQSFNEAVSVAVSLDRFLTDRAPLAADQSLLLMGCSRVTAANAVGAVPGPLCWSRVQVDTRPAEEYPLQTVTTTPRAPPGDQPANDDRLKDEDCIQRADAPPSGACVAWHPLIVPLLLPAGTHQLRLSNRSVDGEVAATVVAPAAGLSFAVETGTVVASQGHRLFPKPRSEGGALEFAAGLPPALQDQPVLLYTRGAWLPAAQPDGRVP